ncbi:MAG: hypothetical protein AAF598_21035, partial [Bacteroidota bacterium]
MILVPNHQRPLNGNKFFVWVFVCCLLILQACNTLKPKPIDPDYGQNKDPKEETDPKANNDPTVGVDTVAWTDMPENTPHPVFTEPEVPEID